MTGAGYLRCGQDRATGPHLHWSLQWQGAKLDPLSVALPIAR
ncbi:hypothetical protein [Sphingomonas sp.]